MESISLTMKRKLLNRNLSAVAAMLGIILLSNLLVNTSFVLAQSTIGEENVTRASTNIPLNFTGTIHHFTNNNTEPVGVWVLVGTWSLKITDNNNNATFVADVTQGRTGNVPYEQRNETSTHITNFRAQSVTVNDTRIAINGTADNVQNGLPRFEGIPVSILIVGGETIPYSQIFVTQGGEAAQTANGATPWYGTVDQKIE
jgi:hypothetical protein